MCSQESVTACLSSDPVHIFYFFKANFNIIPCLWLSHGLFPSRYPTETFYEFISPTHTTFITPLVSFFVFGDRNIIWWRVQTMKFIIMQFSPTWYYFLSVRSNHSSQNPAFRCCQSRIEDNTVIYVRTCKCITFSSVKICCLLSVWNYLQ
jgi:hypothetical protein